MSSETSDTASPVLTISILCIIGAAALLLLAYYAFLAKLFPCSFFTTQPPPATVDEDHEDSFIALSPTNLTRTLGLHDRAIRDLPTRHYHTKEEAEEEEGSYPGCVVCLSNFHDREILRVLPNCAHSFHVDCIDAWLRTNSNCPVCRTGINHDSSSYGVVAPSSSPRVEGDSVIGSDEDFVVIELGGERSGRYECDYDDSVSARRQSPAKQGRQRRRHASIMGDEGIDVGGSGDGFGIELPTMRRSFSWDSAADRHLLSSVRAVVRQSSSGGGGGRRHQGCGGEDSSRGGRSLLPFGKIMRGSRNSKSVIPLRSDLFYSVLP